MRCESKKITGSQIRDRRKKYVLDPVYQRESGVWNLDRRQLFIDSVINRYDIPKIYVHVLTVSETEQYVLVDGKQRLTTIWDFLGDVFPLADECEYEKDDKVRISGKKYSELPEMVQDEILDHNFDFVLIQEADEQDVEGLFARLNNGEPLKAAEKRNAMGGAMNDLIRKISKSHSVFTHKVMFSNKRFAFYEVVAQCILLELKEEEADVQKRHLDQLVRDHKGMSTKEQDRIKSRVESVLNKMAKAFSDEDPLLRKQVVLPLYYIFFRTIHEEYAGDDLDTELHTFLEEFEARRIENRKADDDKVDNALADFDRMMQQGTNHKESIRARKSILLKRFLNESKDLKVKDSKRSFSEEERFVIWMRAKKRCQTCRSSLKKLDEMHADHWEPWSKGGETIFDNAQCLCRECNLTKSAKT